MPRSRPWFSLACSLAVSALITVSAMVDAGAQPMEEGFRQLAAGWDKTLKDVEGELEHSIATDQAGELRKRLDQVRTEAQQHARAAQRKADELNAFLESLGPVPSAGASEEAPDIRKKRLQLNGALADLNSQVKGSDLASTRSETLLRQISAAQFERRTTDLLVAAPSPLNIETWRKAGADLLILPQKLQVKEIVRSGRTDAVALSLVAVGTYVAIVLGRLLRQRIQLRWGRDPAIAHPTYGRRLIAAVIDGVSQGLVPVLMIVVLLSAVWWFLEPSVHMPWSLLYAIALYILLAALVRAAFSPELPNWRITPISQEASTRIGRRLNLLVLVYTLQLCLSNFFGRIGETPEFLSLQTLVVNLLLAVLMFSLLRGWLWEVPRAAPEWYEEHPTLTATAVSAYLRFLIGVVTLAAVVTAVFGYAALSNYLLHTTMLTLFMVGALMAAHFVLRETFAQFLSASTGPAATIKRALALSEQSGQLISVWTIIGIDCLLVITGVLGALLLWGIPLRDLADWLFGIFKGVTIGSHRFSLADLLLAVAMLVIILVLTQLLKRFLEFRLFPNTRLDIGMRAAVSSVVGYLGAATAVLAAISTLGINLTGLAVVAGALSVGIGFGLQNIVNNFISGIILLVERPVKVGDVVVVGTHEGVIRRIRARSTEIETGQHASVIIPNSDLLQSAVTNWTHRDRIARTEIRVTVSYDVDIEKIDQILRECARQHPRVSRFPEPTVVLSNFGERGLEFLLSYQLPDIDEKARVGSEIRKAILAVFGEAGIEIPVVQRTVIIQTATGPPA